MEIKDDSQKSNASSSSFLYVGCGYRSNVEAGANPTLFGTHSLPNLLTEPDNTSIQSTERGSVILESVDAKGKLSMPCSKCATRRTKLVGATHFCRKCGPFGEYMCEKCHISHDEWLSEHQVKTLSVDKKRLKDRQRKDTKTPTRGNTDYEDIDKWLKYTDQTKSSKGSVEIDSTVKSTDSSSDTLKDRQRKDTKTPTRGNTDYEDIDKWLKYTDQTKRSKGSVEIDSTVKSTDSSSDTSYHTASETGTYLKPGNDRLYQSTQSLARANQTPCDDVTNKIREDSYPYIDLSGVTAGRDMSPYTAISFGIPGERPTYPETRGRFHDISGRRYPDSVTTKRLSNIYPESVKSGPYDEAEMVLTFKSKKNCIIL